MKQTDIDRLKAILQKDGFEVVCQNTLQQVFQIKIKKDPWEGVEFISGNRTNTIRRVVNYDGKLFSYRLRDSGDEGFIYTFGKSYFKPSTEAEYVEQLKREAFELYGEIKEGTMFDRSKMGFIELTTDVIRNTEKGFNYNKEYDRLFFGDISIYNSGKWAKKLPERVEVDFFTSIGTSNESTNGKYIGGKYEFQFIMKKGEYKNLNHFGEYLAKCLEDKLNNE